MGYGCIEENRREANQHGKFHRVFGEQKHRYTPFPGKR
jgi:hypothetical protein